LSGACVRNFKSKYILGLLSSFLISASAFASVSSNDLIVRFKNPQNNALQALGSTFSVTGREADIRIVNSSEGVVRLRFASAEEAKAAEESLQGSDAVDSVAPNFLYSPAVVYRFREEDKQRAEASRFSPFIAPFLAPIVTYPDVLPAPTTVVPGVDPLAAGDWSLAKINMPSVAQLQAQKLLKGTALTAVIDTGVDYNHEDLTGAMWRDPSNAKVVGYDFAHDNATPFDHVKFDIEGCMKDFGCLLGFDQAKYLVNPGHGTHCAGHVAAVTNNSKGIRGIGTSKVMALKMFYDEGHPNAGQGDDVAAVKSIDYAIANGVKVISASWGGMMPKAEAEKSELKAALIRAQKAGILFVVAAGNGDQTGKGFDNDTAASPVYPAAYELDNILTVAATDPNDNLTAFSNFGAKGVHIGAPGLKVFSTTAGSKYDDIVAKFTGLDGTPGQIDWDGTSMATPIVAGAAALLWSAHPEWNYQQIRAQLLNTARKVPALSGKVSSGGVLNVSAALGL
jgi:subtilisin family serine protease